MILNVDVTQSSGWMNVASWQNSIPEPYYELGKGQYRSYEGRKAHWSEEDESLEYVRI